MFSYHTSPGTQYSLYSRRNLLIATVVVQNLPLIGARLSSNLLIARNCRFILRNSFSSLCFAPLAMKLKTLPAKSNRQFLHR